MPEQSVTKLSFQHLQLEICNEKGAIRIKEEKFRLPVDIRGSKTAVLKLSINLSSQWKSNVNKHEEGRSPFSLLSVCFPFPESD